jgi:hypothetical protein
MFLCPGEYEVGSEPPRQAFKSWTPKIKRNMWAGWNKWRYVAGPKFVMATIARTKMLMAPWSRGENSTNI